MGKILQKTMMMTIKIEIYGIVILTIAMALDKVVYVVIKIVKNVLIVVEWFVNNHHNKNSKNDKDNSRKDNDNNSKNDNDNNKNKENNSKNDNDNSKNDKDNSKKDKDNSKKDKDNNS